MKPVRKEASRYEDSRCKSHSDDLSDPLREARVSSRSSLLDAVRLVFSERMSYITLIVSSIIMLVIYLLLPVYLVPGNDLLFNLSLTQWWQYLLFVFLAMGTGLVLTLQRYIWQVKKDLLRSSSTSLLTGFSTILASVFSSATCLSCLSSVLVVFVPASSLLLLIKYRLLIALLRMILIILSLFLSLRTIAGHCTRCVVPASMRATR